MDVKTLKKIEGVPVALYYRDQEEKQEGVSMKEKKPRFLITIGCQNSAIAYAAFLDKVHDHNDRQRNQTQESDTNKDEKQDEEVAQVIIHHDWVVADFKSRL